MTDSDNTKSQLIDYFLNERLLTEKLTEPLSIEDFNLQAILETSPIKWHLAHTSWFFETFIISLYVSGYKSEYPMFDHLFNSYYQTLGRPFPRSNRGLLSRPSVEEIFNYRHRINELICDLLISVSQHLPVIIRKLLLGIHHEQQHQELSLTDILYNFYQNPLLPNYQKKTDTLNLTPSNEIKTMQWINHNSGFVTIGQPAFDFEHNKLPAIDEFCFDNESPEHDYWLMPFSYSDRLVTNEEYIDFIDTGGYRNPAYWLDDGWISCQNEQWSAPLYWIKQDNEWFTFSLQGITPLSPNAPVSHISAFEADAYARFCQARLISEFEWEAIANNTTIDGNFLQNHHLRAMPATQCHQVYGDLWEWTSSSYRPYPGFQTHKGAIGEYNGKFMNNQWVLRGGSCATNRNHIRSSYRNFFQPATRFQFSGFRLARDVT